MVMVRHGQFTIHIGRKMRFLVGEITGDLGIPCSQLILREVHLVPWVSIALSRKPILTLMDYDPARSTFALYQNSLRSSSSDRKSIDRSLAVTWTALSNLIS